MAVDTANRSGLTSVLQAVALAAGLAASLAAAAQDGRYAPRVEANGIAIEAGYAIVAGPSAPTSAAYMRITNTTAADDRLIDARSDAAARVEFHAQVLENGIAKMPAIEGGIVVPAGGTVTLERGGLHVMLMGLGGALAPGGEVNLVLVFEAAGEIPVTLPVDASAAGHTH